MREPYLFSSGKEAEGGVLLTAWLRDGRRLVDEAAKRRGHAIEIGVRVPSHPATALGLGLERTHLGQRAAGRCGRRHAALGHARVRHAAGRVAAAVGRSGHAGRRLGSEHPVLPRRPGTPRHGRRGHRRGGGSAVERSGCRLSVQLFPGWLAGLADSRIQARAAALGSLDACLQLPCRHAVTYRDVAAPSENYQAPLPAKGTDLTFELPLGPTPPAGWRAEAIVELAAESAKVPPPALSVNGAAAALQADDSLPDGNRLLKYSIPFDGLPGRNQDQIQIKAGEKITVVRVAIGLGGG